VLRLVAIEFCFPKSTTKGAEAALVGTYQEVAYEKAHNEVCDDRHRYDLNASLGRWVLVGNRSALHLAWGLHGDRQRRVQGRIGSQRL
jgi:hypothetical protein